MIQTADPMVIVGCYTHRSEVGVRVFSVVAEADELTARSTYGGVEHASFLARHPRRPIVYAVSETTGAGEVVALAVGPSGIVSEIDRAPSRGSTPCHVGVDRCGRHAYIANYDSGSVAAYELEPEGRFGAVAAWFEHRGSGPHPRQDRPHAHSFVPDPNGTTVYAVDLGIDAVHHYRHAPESDQPGMRRAGTTAFAPGSGPRHITFHSRHPIAFVVCELDSTVVSLDVDRATGSLAPRSKCSTLPSGHAGGSIAAAVHVHPNGRTVYVSNRGHDSIAAFTLGPSGDQLSPIGHVSTGGRTPRDFAIDPNGTSMLVANQDTDTITSIAIDPTTGELSGPAIVAALSEPVSIEFLPGAS